MNSELSLKEEINIYINNDLTPSELFILRLLFLAQEGDTILLNNYLSNVKNGKELFKTILINLQEKGFILASFKIVIDLQRDLLDITEKAGDEGTNSQMSDYITEQEKEVWMYNSYLGK